MAIRAGVKIVCRELNLAFDDLPILESFDGQESVLIDVLQLSDTSHFVIQLNCRR